MTLTAVAEEGVTIWWDVDQRDGIGIDGTDASMDANYRRPGAVVVTCIASDGTQVVVERLNLTVQVAAGNSDPVPGLQAEQTGPLTATLDASSSTDADADGLEYRFTFGDGTWSEWTLDAAVDHVYAEAGTYNASVRVRDSRGSDPIRTFLEVTVNTDASNRAPEAALILSTTDVEVGDTVTADGSGATDPDGDTLEYRVDWGDGDETDWSDAPSTTHAYLTEGTYTVTLEIRDPGGLSATVTADVTVEAPPVVTNRSPVASIALDVSTITVGEEVTADFSGSVDPDPGDVLEYRMFWGNGRGGEWSVETTAATTYDVAGTYIVELEVRDRDGLVDVVNATLEVTKVQKDDDDGDDTPGAGVVMVLVALGLMVVVGRFRRR